MAQGYSAAEDRLNEVAQKIEKIEFRVNEVAQKIEKIEFRLNEVAQKIEKIELKKKYSLKPEDLYDDATQLYNKGWRYEQGDGVVKDIEYAKVLYKKAAEKGSQMAKSRLNYLTKIN